MKITRAKEKPREEEITENSVPEKKEETQNQPGKSSGSPPETAASNASQTSGRTGANSGEKKTFLQKKEVKKGKAAGLNEEQIAVYSRSDLNFMQMKVLREAMAEGLSAEEAESIAKPWISAEQMQEMIHEMKTGGTVKVPGEQRWKKWILPGIALFASISGLTVLILEQPPQEPVLELKSSEIRLSAGMEFDPSRYVSGECPEGYELIYPEPFTAEKPEVRLVMYELKGKDTSVKKILRVNIVDEKAPSITLSQNHAELLTATKFACRSYLKAAVDDVDGDVTRRVTCSDTLKDTESQTVLYTVKDRAGNRAEAELSVHFADYGMHEDTEEEETEPSEPAETEPKNTAAESGSKPPEAIFQPSWHTLPDEEAAMDAYEEYEEISWTETVQESVPVTYGETIVEHTF